MKNSVKFASKIVLVALFVTGCKKEFMEPIGVKSGPQVSLSGNAGLKVQKPGPNQQSVTKVNQVNKLPGAKGGTLRSTEIYDTMNRGIIDGKVFQLRNGQRVFLEKLSSGKYNGVKMNKDGSFPETMKNWSSNEIAEMGRNERWPEYIMRGIGNYR